MDDRSFDPGRWLCRRCWRCQQAGIDERPEPESATDSDPSLTSAWLDFYSMIPKGFRISMKKRRDVFAQSGGDAELAAYIISGQFPTLTGDQIRAGVQNAGLDRRLGDLLCSLQRRRPQYRAWYKRLRRPMGLGLGGDLDRLHDLMRSLQPLSGKRRLQLQSDTDTNSETEEEGRVAKRPRGRAPRGKSWSYETHEWIDTDETSNRTLDRIRFAWGRRGEDDHDH